MANQQDGNLVVTSPVFQHEGELPAKYTCEGDAINPPLHIDNIPQGTQTLVIIAEDPDTAKGIFDHWLVWNIPVNNTIAENFVPGISGSNSSGKTGYHPPCPPNGSHRYFFYVFALDAELDLAAGEDKRRLQKTMEKHILAKGTLMGRYQKTSK